MGTHSRRFSVLFKPLNCHHCLLRIKTPAAFLLLECQRRTDQEAALILEMHQPQAAWVFFIGIKGSSSFNLPGPPSRVEILEQSGHSLLSEMHLIAGFWACSNLEEGLQTQKNLLSKLVKKIPFLKGPFYPKFRKHPKAKPHLYGPLPLHYVSSIIALPDLISSGHSDLWHFDFGANQIIKNYAVES